MTTFAEAIAIQEEDAGRQSNTGGARGDDNDLNAHRNELSLDAFESIRARIDVGERGVSKQRALSQPKSPLLPAGTLLAWRLALLDHVAYLTS